ncbi:MAG: hypothetical protein WAO69_02490 [Aestuariivita sp.]|uniref:hypothetical protein n=1 Tax=Aestuariivita sp. TaxID=1872407 RepID=UPI003BB1FE35
MTSVARYARLLSCLAGSARPSALVLLAALAAPAVAQDWTLPEGQEVLSYEQARGLTSGRTLSFPGLGQSTYFTDGRYVFKGEDRSILQFGMFEVRRDGKVCVNLYSDGTRCDVFLKNHGLLFMLTEKGDRFPVQLEIEVR